MYISVQTLVYQNNPFWVFIFSDSIQVISFIINDNVLFQNLLNK